VKPVPLSTRHVIRTFDLTELPAASETGAAWPATARQNAAYARDLELVPLVNLFVTVSPLPEPTSALEPPARASGGSIGCTGADSVCAKIYFREPVMRVIRVHVAESADAGNPRSASFSIGEERIVPLVSAADPILHIAFGTQVLGAGKMALAFGAHGNVTGVEQSSSAALNNAVGAAASGYESARAAYDAALKARVDELELEIKLAKYREALRDAESPDSSPSSP
jgi:hypothetical protein